MKIVKTNQKPQETYYTPFRSLVDDFFSFPRWDEVLPTFDNLFADIWEKDNNIFVKMAMPGIKKDDIKITVNGDTLSIEGSTKEKTEEKDDKKYFLRSFQNYSYSQRFNLPATIDTENVDAKFEDGVLTVKLPKAKEYQTKEITVN